MREGQQMISGKDSGKGQGTTCFSDEIQSLDLHSSGATLQLFGTKKTFLL